MAEEGKELTADIACTVIMEAWPKVQEVTVRDIWVDSEGVANVRAEWSIEGTKLMHNLRMGLRNNKIEIL